MADPFSWFPNPLDPFGAFSAADDLLNKDESAKLSAILARNGWGSAQSQTNRMARAVVQRESNGDPNAYNNTPCSTQGDNAVGLFQMCTVHKGRMGIPADKDKAVTYLKDPDNNARAARALHRANGWQPWAASGGVPAGTDWDPEIKTDKDSLSGEAASTAGDVAGAVASPFVAVGNAAVDLIGTLLSADTWFRIGKGWVGFVFVITGTGALVFIVANKASGGQVARTAKTAAKVATTKKVA